MAAGADLALGRAGSVRIVRWLVAIGALAALVVGSAAAWRLHRAGAQAARAVTPVAVPLHALFAPDTHAVVTVRGLDAAYGELRAWWDQCDDTATWWHLRRLWDEERAALPAPLIEALASLDRDLGEAERRLGHRPTTAEFFEAYGRESAFALLPAAAGRPRLVACTRLPDQARADALTGTLAAVPELRRLPDALHGYPCFEELMEGAARRLFAVGGGFLFVSDDAAALAASLERLAAWAEPGTGPLPPSLHGDAVLARVAPDGAAALTCWVRRAQGFAGFDPDLAVADQLVDRAFVLAPGDPAVAVALVRPAPGRWALRASFLHAPTRPFTALLPAGLAELQHVTPQPGSVAAGAAAELERLRRKPLWGELEALLRDGPRLTQLCEEALPPEWRPRAELVQRIPADARLLGRLAEGLFADAATGGGGELAIATKHFRAPDASEQAFGVTLSAELAFLAAGGLDLLAERYPDWVTARHPAPGGGAAAPRGYLAWRTGLRRLLADAQREARSPVDLYAGVDPVIFLVGRQLLVCSGSRLADEVRALLDGTAGTTPLAQDPEFQAVTADLPPGAVSLTYTRPAEYLAGGWRQVQGMVEAMTGPDTSEDARALLEAVRATVDAGFGWAAARRATATATYAGGDEPVVTRTRLDPDVAARAPAVEGPAAPVEALGWLPAGTWWLHAAQVRPRAAWDELRRVFLAALPGGEARFEQLRRRAGLAGEPIDAVVDACLEGLLRNLDGALGVAVAMPPPLPEEAQPGDPNAWVAAAPAVVCFAQFADVEAAWGALRSLLAELDRTVNDEPFDARVQRAQAHGLPLPFGLRTVEGAVEGVPVLALDLLIPLGGNAPYLVPSVCCLRRGSVVAITNSVGTWRQMLAQAEGGEGSLAARLRADLPPEALPAAERTLTLLRPDGAVDHAEQVLHQLAPHLAPLTLGGYRRRPPQPRIDAHLAGWRRAIALCCDLFRDPAWHVACDVRQGDMEIRSMRRHRAR
jgi:hypothetical protein